MVSLAVGIAGLLVGGVVTIFSRKARTVTWESLRHPAQTIIYLLDSGEVIKRIPRRPREHQSAH